MICLNNTIRVPFGIKAPTTLMGQSICITYLRVTLLAATFTI